MRRLAIVAALALIAAPASASFTAQNGLTVAPGGQSFDIAFSGRSAARDFWCAAGDYAINGLNLSPTTKIWRLSEPPRRMGEGMRFSFSPEGAASSSGLFVITKDGGAGISAGFAQHLCEIRNTKSR